MQGQQLERALPRRLIRSAQLFASEPVRHSLMQPEELHVYYRPYAEQLRLELWIGELRRNIQCFAQRLLCWLVGCCERIGLAQRSEKTRPVRADICLNVGKTT